MMNYIGITIGPIIETLELTSTPAGLWGASYMFSCITRDICRIITAGLVLSDNNNHKVSDQDIVSPYFSSEKDKDPEPRGIGKYHDRVIFRDKDGYGYELAQMAAEKVKTELADKFAAELGTDRNLMRTYFSNYIQIHVTSREVGDNESPIIAVNDILDCLELSRTFVPQIQSDPILSLLDSEDSQGHNDRIRKSFMVSQLSEWQLRSGSGAGIRDLESIASCNALTRAFKYQYYYAVVQADGDNMGNYIKSFGRDTQSLRKFSQNCLSYTTDAADLIIGYGGVVIYAGGDDLLFLAPVINNDNKTLFQLLIEIKDKFNDDLKSAGTDQTHKETSAPTISFGVSIQYYKSPLYEAFDNTRRLLFGTAKKVDYTAGNGVRHKKNSLAVSLSKHSGQSMGFIATDLNNVNINDMSTDPGKADEPTLQKVNRMIGTHIDGDFLKSVLTHLYQFRILFVQALNDPEFENKREKTLEHLFDNIFDNEGQKSGKDYIGSVCRMLAGLMDIEAVEHKFEGTNNDDTGEARADGTENTPHKDKEIQEEPLVLLDHLLRFIKFCGEKPGER